MDKLIEFLKSLFGIIYDLLDKIFSNKYFQTFAPIILEFAQNAIDEVDKIAEEAEKNGTPLSSNQKKEMAFNVVKNLAKANGFEYVSTWVINRSIEDAFILKRVEENSDFLKETAMDMGTHSGLTARERRPK